MTDLTPPSAADAAVTTPTSRRVGTMYKNGNGQYRDPERAYQRVSTLLKNLKTSADSDALDKWKLRQVGLGLAARPDLVLAIAAAKQVGDDGKLTWESKSAINKLCKQASDAAGSRSGSNQGTAVHTATERLDLGETAAEIALPYPFSADLAAYEALKRAMRLTCRPELIERSVRCEELGVVGTFDRVSECELLVEMGILAPDESIVVDVKTEAEPLLNLIHIAPQLATYAYGDAMWRPDPEPARLARAAGREPTTEELAAGAYEPLPNVSKTVGLVIHLRNGKAVPYLVDLIEGWEAACGAAEQRERVKRSRIKLGEPGCWAAPLDVELPPAVAIVQSAAEARLAADRERAEAAAAPAAVVEQSVRGADGLVRWEPVAQANPLAQQLVEAILAADSLPDLARLYDLAQQNGVSWRGVVAYEAEQRRQIIECVQRDLHTGSAVCACGWRTGMAS